MPTSTSPVVRGLAREDIELYLPERNPQDPANPPRLRGDATLVPMPDTSLLPREIPVDDHEDRFYLWMSFNNIWTLAYTERFYQSMFELQSEFPDDWEGIKQEIFPSAQNSYCHRKHGTYSVYAAHCRGPLCKWAKRMYARHLEGHASQSTAIEKRDALIEDAALSFWMYREYVKYIREWRIANLTRKRDDPLNWRSISFYKTFLIDSSDI